MFDKKLTLFRNEITAAENCYYLHKTIHLMIGNDNDLYAEVNKNSLFGNSVLSTTQVSLFITLGRIFDKDNSSFSVLNLLKDCNRHKDLFTKSQLELRKRTHLSPENAAAYVKDMPEELATDEEFEFLKKQVESCKDIFDKNYKPLRNKIFGHKDISYIGRERELFSQTMVGEIEAILICLIG